jgi:hypothetical protein
MTETARVRSFIYQTLTGDATMQGLIGTKLYNGVIPAATALPAGVMQLLSGGNDLMGVGGVRIWADTLWLVKFIAKGASTGPLEPIAARADELLHAASGTVNNGVIWECVRERPFELPTVENGVNYVQLGGEYRIKASRV